MVTKGAQRSRRENCVVVRRASLSALGDLVFIECIVSNPYTIYKLPK
jgi:hypothetical protein